MKTEALLHLFREQYPGDEPAATVFAPGRVNLIGEHTDYNGYPVLPMAVRRSMSIALSPRQDRAIVVKSPLEGYGSREFDIDEEIPQFPAGDWGNYVKAAAQALAQRFSGSRDLNGFNAVVIGNIPSGAGLSSSSALVVASGLALLSANGLHDSIDRLELAELFAEAEHYVGTQGGGMDQTACLMASEGHALRIDFFPIQTKQVPFPREAGVVVANSLVVAEKTGNALAKYNRRPLECKMAAKMLALWHGLDSDAVQRLAQAEPPEEAWTLFRETSYSKEEIAGELMIGVDELDRLYMTMRDGTVFPEPEDGFRLHDRVRHVLTEAERVDAATLALSEGDVERVGELMNASHVSCAEDYGISTPELDALTGIMRDAGALGARLTGAGFGGCAIALARTENVAPVMDAVRNRYYGEFLGLKEDLPDGIGSWDDVLFTTDAGPGAHVEPV